MPDASKETAESMIRAIGARLTRPRVEILKVLLAAERALSHHEVEGRISRSLGVDRVTIYRVLDWLNREGLAHKISGEDRVWRYNAAEGTHSEAHAHFQCGGCGTVICLDDLRERVDFRVPRGFVSHEVVLTVKGLCATCVHTPARPATPHGSAQSGR
jgi:Fur family ferric uptake transcriptional regulator